MSETYRRYNPQQRGDNMELKVFVGMFRYVEDGNIELVVSTTEQ